MYSNFKNNVMNEEWIQNEKKKNDDFLYPYGLSSIHIM